MGNAAAGPRAWGCCFAIRNRKAQHERCISFPAGMSGARGRVRNARMTESKAFDRDV